MLFVDKRVQCHQSSHQRCWLPQHTAVVQVARKLLGQLKESIDVHEPVYWNQFPVFDEQVSSYTAVRMCTELDLWRLRISLNELLNSNDARHRIKIFSFHLSIRLLFYVQR